VSDRPVVLISGSVREALFAQPLVGALEGACVVAPAESLSVLRLETVGRGFATGSSAGLDGAWWRLRRLPATLVVAPPPVSGAAARLAYFSGIQRRVGRAGARAWWATERVPVPAGLHPVDTIARLAAAVVARPIRPGGPRLDTSEQVRTRVEARLQSAGLDRAQRLLVVIPGHGNWIRRGSTGLWPAERLAVLVNQLHPDGLVIVRGAGDARRVRELGAGVPITAEILRLDAVTPDELAALARQSVGVIGHDGDAVHVAAAGGGRVLSLLNRDDIAPFGADEGAFRVDDLASVPALAVVEAARRYLGAAAYA
jgi:ADP-heptose:LPS heptosyltransferase